MQEVDYELPIVNIAYVIVTYAARVVDTERNIGIASVNYGHKNKANMEIESEIFILIFSWKLCVELIDRKGYYADIL